MPLAKRAATVLMLAWGVGTAPFAVSAAELTLVSYRFSDEAPIPHLHLSGPLEQGDADRFAREFDVLAPCSGGLCHDVAHGGSQAVVTLDSPGGAYSAGVALADVFRDMAIATYIETEGSCLSACALAFLGGTGFWPTGGIGPYFDRRLEPGARLGFHSPYFTARIAERAAREGQLTQLLDGTRLAIADIVETLSRYNVSQQILHDIIRMGPEEFYEVSTPGALVGIRASLPHFDPALLALPWEEQVTNVCRHLAAWHYGVAPEDMTDFMPETPSAATAEDGTAILLFDIGDRPTNVSGCGVDAETAGGTLDRMSLYAAQIVPDTHSVLLDFQNEGPLDINNWGWSSFADRGGSATDGYVTRGALTHMLMPLDADLGALPDTVSGQIRNGRGRDADPRLPRHAHDWPVDMLHVTPWSRSMAAQGMTIIEQSGPARLFDEIAVQAEDTEILYRFDRDNIVVRSGQDRARGTSYYWIGLRAGDRSATLRIQAPVLAQDLTGAQRDLMGQLACTIEFEGVHLDCYG